MINPPRTAALVAVVLLAATSCSSTDDAATDPQADPGSAGQTTASQLADGSQPADGPQPAGSPGDGSSTSIDSATAAPPPPAPAPAPAPAPGPTVPEPAIASATAESYKILAPTIDELTDGVREFVATITPTRLDQLATQACLGTAQESGELERGLQGVAAYQWLTTAERSIVGVEDWLVFYGSTLGYFCPEKVESDAALESPPGGSALVQFQAVVNQLTGVSAEATGFVSSIDEATLNRLRTGACSGPVGPDNETFGQAIIERYDADLSDADRAQLSLNGYGELHGALVGWYCPANLPR